MQGCKNSFGLFKAFIIAYINGIYVFYNESYLSKFTGTPAKVRGGGG